MMNYLRKILNKSIKIPDKMFCFIFKYFTKKSTFNVCIYPMIETREDLSDIINRVAWWLPYKANLRVTIPVSKELLGITIKDLQNPPSQRSYFYKRLEHIEVKNNYGGVFQDRILLTDEKRIYDLHLLLRASRVAVIDRINASKAGGVAWENTYRKSYSSEELSYFDELSKYNFTEMCSEYRDYNKAYCFATGPSFKKYQEFKFDNQSIKIVCNSAIIDDDFLKHIKGPNIVAFMDRIGFFSTSEFAAFFRDKLTEVNKKYSPYIITKIERLPLLLAHYPELESRVIGIKVKNKFPLSIPTPDSLKTKEGSNVLTSLMIPVASALAKTVLIFGADGIDLSKYSSLNKPWDHGINLRKKSLEQTIVDVHPKNLEKLNYIQVYKNHYMFLNELLLYGESQGTKYRSITPSHIRALQERYDVTL